MSTNQPKWAQHIAVRNFQGVDKFYDILPLLANGAGLADALAAMDETVDTALDGRLYQNGNDQDRAVDYFVGVESRGFIFATVLAYDHELGLILARKAGKTPGDTVRMQLSKEYGKDVIEIQKGLFEPGAKVVIIDDVVATGGTLLATAELVKQLGGQVVAIVTLAELTEVKNEDGRTGRQVLEDAGYKLASTIKY